MEITSRKRYLEHIKATLVSWVENYDAHLQSWENDIKLDNFFGYCPPGLPISCAFTEAFLFDLEKNQRYAERAKQRLISYRQFTEAYPPDYKNTRIEYQNGLPPISSFFLLLPYLQAYTYIKNSTVLTPEDHKTIEGIVADSIAVRMRFPEWGAHNRTILWAASLSAAAKAFPSNAESKNWSHMARILAYDSIGKWSIEDAMSYHGIWLFGLIRYADIAGEDFFHHITTKYYFDYFASLLAPSGMLPDFGDSNWNHGWSRYVACFERGAREYQDPKLRYVACRIYDSMHKLAGGPKIFGTPEDFIAAYLWMDENILPEKPTTESQEVLDELVGKKIIFRNGWEDKSTFLLLNYKPETDYGYTQREYLKNTISVEAEKAHHGHSDENSICLLMHNGSVLLHESGYRDTLPNGKFRADFYHNRVVSRQGAPKDRGSILEFLQDAGVHRPVETQKIDFMVFKDVDMSRTRVIDHNLGYQWDRIIVYLKEEELFAIIDGIKILPYGTYSQGGAVTFSNLFYTRQIYSQGEGYFDTGIDQLREYKNSDNSSLLICFPKYEHDVQDFWEGICDIRRYYQNEKLVHQTLSKEVEPGDMIVFLTALIPHTKGGKLQELVRKIHSPGVSCYPQAAAVEIKTKNGKITLGVKLDLESEILGKNVRPRYNWASAATRYGDAQTDARFSYFKEQNNQLGYAFTEGTRVIYKGKEIFAGKRSTFGLQPEGKQNQDGIPKWRAWEEFNIPI